MSNPPADQIDPRLDAAAVKRRAHPVSGKGTVHFAECRTCGFIEWVSSNPEPKTHFVASVGPMWNPGNCPSCSFAFQRHPELAQWVVGVAQIAAREAVKTAASEPPK